MTAEAVAKWLFEHSTIPQKALKPIATKLGISTNYVGAALFAGQIVYENQDTIVEYTSKGGVTVGEFLHARARERYGEDHPLTQHLGENVAALDEAFEGTEEEARTFAAFYSQYREVDREHRLRDELGRGMPDSLTDAIPSKNDLPGGGVIPSRDDVPGSDAIPGGDAVPGVHEADPDPDETVEIPVTDEK